MQKRLARSTTDKKITGVCGGIADHFGWDPTMVRIGWVLLCFAEGLGIVLYLILSMIMPEAADRSATSTRFDDR